MHSAKCEKAKTGNWATGLGKLALGACLLAGISGTAMAESMIVRSIGPSAKAYPAGKKLPDSAKISLKALDQVTILRLGKSGTRVLKGPGTFSLGGNSATRTTASGRIAGFIAKRGNSRARTGAIRGAGSAAVTEAPKNPNLWFLDITKGGNFCVANPAALVLWRPDYTGSATASIVEPNSGNVTQVEWRKGNPLKAWPKAEVPITNGASYRLIGSNVDKSVEVKFVILNDAPENLDDAAEVLIRNGCDSQIDLMVDTLAADDGSSGSAGNNS